MTISRWQYDREKDITEDTNGDLKTIKERKDEPAIDYEVYSKERRKKMDESKPTMKGFEIAESRQKYWDELEDKEKIERLRHIVKGMDFELSQMRDLVNKLRMHIHTGQGMTIPLEYDKLMLNSIPKDNKYF